VRWFPVVPPLFLSLVCAAPPALAAKGESSLSVSAAYNEFCLNQDPEPNVSATGGLLLLEYERGINDTLWVRGAGGGGIYTDSIYSLNGVAGITFALDVLKYIPYLNLGLGAVYLDGGPVTPGFRTFIELGFGVEILHSRTFSYGLHVRYDSFASDLASYLSMGARVTWRWGFF
jgi:hypothetical protein